MEFAVTVIGRDRIGIVADVAGRLADLRANLTDSTMSLLRGHFAMMLICTADASADQLREALEPLEGLIVSVSEVATDGPATGHGASYVLTVHGADRLGIVADVARAVAEAGGNITDLSTRLSGSLYVLVAEVDFPGANVNGLGIHLTELASNLGVEINLRAAGADVL